MKLSEILGWKKKPEETIDSTNPYCPYCQSRAYDGIRYYSIPENEGFNEAITTCDREIDREALEEILLKPGKSQDNNINFGVVNAYKARYLAQAIIYHPRWWKHI